MSSVVRPLPGTAFIALILAATAMPAAAAKKQPVTPQPVVERFASGTIIQPTTTIVPDRNGLYGPDLQGTGRYPLPSAFDGTGINPNTPF